MLSLAVIRNALCCLSAVLAPLAAAAPLAPFALTKSGAVEIRYSGYQAASADHQPATAGVLRESGFAAGYLTSITGLDNPSDSFWHQSQNNQSISFMMYGMGDASSAPATGGLGKRTYSVGCTNAAFGCDGLIHLDFYLDQQIGGTNPGFGLGGVKASDRQGFGKLQGITDGELLMSWVFAPGLVNGPVAGMSDPGFNPYSTTLFQEFDGMPIPAYGTGAYLADCVSGPGCLYFRSGSNAGGADFFGINTLTRTLAGSIVAQNGWSTRIANPVVAQVALPEPGMLALIAVGLLGLAMRRRRGGPCAP